MNASAQYGTPVGDATLAIQKLARKSGADVQELQTLYVLEALLGRIAHSPYRDDFVLKGGVLLAAFAARRPTRDIDVQATGVANDVSEVEERIRLIAGIELKDGVVFDPETIGASIIRESDHYVGIRVKLVGVLGRARLNIGIDVNFGDPIWPEPLHIEFPRLIELDLPPLWVLGYPMSMVFAEKTVTVFDRGVANTRWRDFADIYVLLRRHPASVNELLSALTIVAGYRGVRITSVLPELEPMRVLAQPGWAAWRNRTHRTHDLPESFSEVLLAISGFVDPLLTRLSYADATWNPPTGTWVLDD
ncbi:nucleotidyl transferase AbiEii/AbiGii toxin family protein [Mycetocola tolaasinivorans]|uniref:Nucleotidyl transferase AbiEii/AbiGii toxin family protein n=1 Tax=Mycetocola tolaasinivorans TaxID=76635 RepID=A0A3L7ACZ0_9MICO|nr:nucleotidyl transferase AbiEii/AbiGii toxin family protein [Mycetocola tolaasinivorans]RLP77885.1 nucleotidyl transferase AbiEii/AbiGii toxin family protein [Mycetocola tolaasinivorans]